jgi:hypothetical protein
MHQETGCYPEKVMDKKIRGVNEVVGLHNIWKMEGDRGVVCGLWSAVVICFNEYETMSLYH